MRLVMPRFGTQSRVVFVQIEHLMLTNFSVLDTNVIMDSPIDIADRATARPASGLDLEEFRRARGLTYNDIASRVGLSTATHARRYARGERWPSDPAVLDRIVAMSGGAVTIEAMHRRRREFIESTAAQGAE